LGGHNRYLCLRWLLRISRFCFTGQYLGFGRCGRLGEKCSCVSGGRSLNLDRFPPEKEDKPGSMQHRLQL
jgi:hypothetical protein